MEIRRLRLVNFRQHADTVLTFERGLTGIVGPNGAGKSTLLEAIAWAIYGSDAARGTKDTIRRRGAPPRSRVEVELDFVLGPHRYRIVRSLANAELYLDGDTAPIANSLGTVTERLMRALGMSRDEFFNTYFTGQKELAIMAQMTAPERAQFLSKVLGYEKLKTAQLRLKERRRALAATLEARKSELIDPAQLAADQEHALSRLRAAEEASARIAAALREAEAVLARLRPEGERWDALRGTVLSLEGDLKVAEHGAEAAREQFTRLDRDLAEALAAKARLDELVPALQPLAALRQEREALDAERETARGKVTLEARRKEIQAQLGRVEQRLGQLPQAEEAERAAASRAEYQVKLERMGQEVEAARTAWVREKQDAETQRKNLLDQVEDLKQQRKILKKAGPEGVCPTCSRPLGKEFAGVIGLLERQIEEVVENGRFYAARITQLAKEPAALAELNAERTRLEKEASQRTEAAARVGQQVAERVRLEAERVTLGTQVAELEARIQSAPERYDEARHEEVKRRILALEPQALEAERMRATADRAGELIPRAQAAEQELSQREAAARALREQLTGLGWSPERFEQVRTQLKEAERTLQQAEVGKARAAGELTAALAHNGEVQRRREERERRAAEVQRLSDEVLLQHELDRALGDLRTELNDALRPDLSALASEFLRDLTAGRYDDLELNEEYVATIIEDGEPKPVISGGEEDVANLALRLAISQMIAERAGQPLSLLVLDEVFGSLDEERRASVVELLRRLSDRFPQVILITHIESVREGFDRVIRLSYDVEARVARAVTEQRDAAA